MLSQLVGGVGKVYWYLVGRGQRCYQAFCNAQDSPPQHRIARARTGAVTGLRSRHQGVVAEALCSLYPLLALYSLGNATLPTPKLGR